MATLSLTFGRRDTVGGRLVRLSGRFEATTTGRREVLLTDCLTYVRLEVIAPGANPVFSYARGQLSQASGRLAPGRDWYVYVKVRGRPPEYSNAVRFPATETGHEIDDDIVKVKRANFARLDDRIGALAREITEMNATAAAHLRRARTVQAISTFLADKFTQWADELTDALVGKVEEQDLLEAEKKAMQDGFSESFPGERALGRAGGKKTKKTTKR